MGQFVLGLDIGYSNLKMVMGHKGGEVRTVIMPVGAGPLELMPQQLTGGAGASIQVVIDGEKWVAGVEPDRLQGWERELHGDYPSTNPYRALFYAALLMSEQKEIDVLVTGLPVSQYMEVERREALKARLLEPCVSVIALELLPDDIANHLVVFVWLVSFQLF